LVPPGKPSLAHRTRPTWGGSCSVDQTPWQWIECWVPRPGISRDSRHHRGWEDSSGRQLGSVILEA
jgi:hypothetical protein